MCHALVAAGNTIVDQGLIVIQKFGLHPLVSNVIIKHSVATFTNQLGCTPHLHGWLSENVFLSLLGGVIHDTKSDTFLLSV